MTATNGVSGLLMFKELVLTAAQHVEGLQHSGELVFTAPKGIEGLRQSKPTLQTSTDLLTPFAVVKTDSRTSKGLLHILEQLKPTLRSFAAVKTNYPNVYKACGRPVAVQRVGFDWPKDVGD